MDKSSPKIRPRRRNSTSGLIPKGSKRWLLMAAIFCMLFSYIPRPCYRRSEASDSGKGPYRILYDWNGGEFAATNRIANISSAGHSRLLRRDLISEFRRAGTAFTASSKEAGHLKLQEKLTPLEKYFWQQPEAGNWRPCLTPSAAYQLHAKEVIRAEIYIVAVVTGGLNQMKRQVGTAVVMAHILEASLVVPVFAFNSIWKDRSEFADLFDVAHFRHTLASDVKIVTTLPESKLRMNKAAERMPPLFSTPEWLQTNIYPRLRKDHVMILRGLDDTLADDLPLDLQKLRCKVEFEALRFAEPIQSFGLQLLNRLRSGGPYLALHLRLEKDVWIRTGCSPGLGPESDDEIQRLRDSKPELLTSKQNLNSEERLQAGLCPMSASMVVRLLKSFGASNKTRIFWAGGAPFGGEKALDSLHKNFGEIHTKESLAKPGELDFFNKHGNMLAALDFILSVESDVFMPSHGGNMAHVIQGHRTFFGPKKCITLNKRRWIKLFLDPELDEDGFGREVRKIAAETGHVLSRTGRDVVGYPIPKCMCQTENGPPEIARDASVHPEKRDSLSPPETLTSEEIQHLSDA